LADKLEDIIVSFDNKHITISKHNTDDIKWYEMIKKDKILNLYQSQVYDDIIFIKESNKGFSSSSIANITDVKDIIDSYLNKNLNLLYKYTSKYAFISAQQLSNVIHPIQIMSSLPKFNNIFDIIILEKDNLCYKLLFSDTYINVIFLYCFQNNKYHLYPMLKFLNKQYKRKKYFKCNIELEDTKYRNLLQKNANEFNILKLILKLEFDDEFFKKEISIRLKNHEHILDILNINQFKIENNKNY